VVYIRTGRGGLTVGFGVVVNSRIGRVGNRSDWAIWKTVGLGVVVNSRFGRGGKQSVWASW
jgi:hypothetical protein